MWELAASLKSDVKTGVIRKVTVSCGDDLPGSDGGLLGHQCYRRVIGAELIDGVVGVVCLFSGVCAQRERCVESTSVVFLEAFEPLPRCHSNTVRTGIAPTGDVSCIPRLSLIVPSGSDVGRKARMGRRSWMRSENSAGFTLPYCL